MSEVVGFSRMFPYYTISTAIAMILSLAPIPAHWRIGNVATVSLGLWAAGGNLIAFVNSIVWRGNMNNPHPIWGDITSFYFTNMGVAIASCTLAIIYRIYEVSKSRSIRVTKAQGHRYNIFEDLGPYTTFYLTLPSFFIYLMWEPLICLISAIYCVLSIRFLLKKRREFDIMFGTQSAHLTKNRYTRLLALSAVGISIHLPISTYVLIVDAAVFPISPWISWDDTHSNYGRIAYFSRFIIDATPFSRDLMILSYSLVPTAGIFYFAFFGFGEEAFRQYRAVLWWLLKPLRFLKLNFAKFASASAGTGSRESSRATVIVSKPPKRFGIFPRPETPSNTPFAQNQGSLSSKSTGPSYLDNMFSSFARIRSPSSSRSPGPIGSYLDNMFSSFGRTQSPLPNRSTGKTSSYLDNMFSSFGTTSSNDVRSRVPAIDSQLPRVAEAESYYQSQSQSQHQYRYPQVPFNLNLAEIPPPESARRALPSSGVPTRRNSSNPDLSEGIEEEKERNISDHRALTLVPGISSSRPCSEASSLAKQSDKDEKAGSMFIPVASRQNYVLDLLPNSNQNGQQGHDLETGSSTFYTETLAAIETARARFKQDNPELTEEVTF